MVNAPKKIETNEFDLIAAVLDRDRKATAEFVERYANCVYSYVRHRLIPRTDMVEDVVQDVFLAAWRGLAEFRAESSLREWLLGIARHKVEDYYRKRLRDPLALADFPEDDPTEPVMGAHIDELLDRERRAQKASSVLRELSEIHALVLLWRYWEKRSTQEIATASGKSQKGVERTLARARAEFKRRWNDA